MKYRYNVITLLIFILLICSSCSNSFIKAIRSGKVVNDSFSEKISFDEKLGLIIVPVVINGKIYRFLWDTGAISSISEEIQNELQFTAVSKGHVEDSDGSRKVVRYVRIDTMKIGAVAFSEQTLFVADFKANPIIKCLQVDGIVGRNLMRHCNWTIDYESYELTMSSTVIDDLKQDAIQLPFKYDNVFDIKLDRKIGSVSVPSLKVDYGSNCSLTLPNEIFNNLKERKVIVETFVQIGSKNSGLIGKPIRINREYAYTDSLFIGNQMLEDVEVKAGSRALIGAKILSRYLVTIDWKNKQLYLKNYKVDSNQNETYGFSLGIRANEIIVQSVIIQSAAYQNGLKPEMIVTRLNALDFTKTATYCDYIDLIDTNPDELTIYYKDDSGQINVTKIMAQSLN